MTPKKPITLVLLRDSDHPARHITLRPWVLKLGGGLLLGARVGGGSRTPTPRSPS